MPDIKDDLLIALMAARAGASVVREQFGRIGGMRIKESSNTIVTETDLAAEEAILKVLTRESDYTIVSEESGVTGESAGPRWIVDPVDGTANFARHLPLFAVSVALAEGKNLFAGVIIDPVHKEEYYASLNRGAFCNNEKLAPHAGNNRMPALFLNHGHKDGDKKRCAEVAQRLSTKYNLRKLGTTALELCYVAKGMFDGFICSGDELWDFAAGVVIAREAGFLFTDWNGEAWDGNSNFILIARPEIHGNLIEEINGLQS